MDPISVQADNAAGEPPPARSSQAAADEPYADHRDALKQQFTVHGSPFTAQ